MSNETTISGLGKASGLQESDIIPVVNIKGSLTEQVSLSTLRNSIYFQNAFSDHTTGLAATSKGDMYFVYTDATETYVKGWVNQGGSNYSAMIGVNGDVIFPAGNLFSVLKSYVIGVDSFDDLRNLTPLYAGQRIKLLAWHSGGFTGGGEFVAVMSNGTDDGGTVASNGGNYYWQRVGSVSDLTIDHFGAIPDGSTDIYSAMLAMHNFTQANMPQLGIVFGSGEYRLLTDFDVSSSAITYFRMAGKNNSDFGYFNETTLYLSKSNTISVSVKSRFTTITNLTVDGEIKTVSNTQGFFQNTQTQGQYFRSSNFVSRYMGGKTFQLIDTLDTKLDQFYTSNNTGTFLSVTYSGEASWDHSTAIELSNFNMQYCTVNNIFDIVRATQCIIRNGWIEHSEYPGNLSEGDWVIDNLSMEDCANKLQVQFAKIIQKQTNLQGDSGFDYNSGASANASNSSYESGRINIHSNAVSVLGAGTFQYQTSQTIIPGGSSDQWVLVGHFYLSAVGESCRVKILGTNGFNLASATTKSVTSSMGAGECIIDMQQKSSTGKFTVSWFNNNNSSILDVMYTQPYNNDVYLYVKVASYSYRNAMFIESTSPNRIESGTHFFFDPSLTVVSDITTVSNILSAPAVLSFHNGNYGFGMDLDSGNLLISAPLDNTGLKIPVMVNGNLRYLNVTTS